GYDMLAVRRGIIANLSTLMDVVVDNSTAALTFHDEKVARELLDSLRAQSNITAACIYDEDGKPFVTYVRDKDALFSPPPPKGEGVFWGNNHLSAFRKIWLKGDLLGSVYLESDFSEMKSRLRVYPTMVVLVLLISSLASLLLASWLQR